MKPIYILKTDLYERLELYEAAARKMKPSRVAQGMIEQCELLKKDFGLSAGARVTVVRDEE